MSPTRRENLFGVACTIAAFAIVATAWDAKDVRQAAGHAEAKAAELKDRALKWAVEHYGRHEYFASDAHCALPLRGERLVMQAAAPRDPGSGYRCTYYRMRQDPRGAPVAIMTWSRSPDVFATAPAERSPR